MKSFNEQVKDVISAKSSKAMKIKSLKALNITDFEIQCLLATSPVIRDAAKRFQFTFGVEIETFGFTRDTLLAKARENGLNAEYQGYNHIDSNTIYKFVTDSSISDNNGRRDTAIECVTPVLSGNKKGYNSLKNCCDTLNACDAQINKSCGLHVHIGAAKLTDAQYVNVFVNYQHLELVIDSFMSKSRRGADARWCAGIRRFNYNGARTKQDVYDIMRGRYFKVNPVAYGAHKTIEFRQHQGTTDYEKISHWVRFCAGLVAWSRDHRLDSDVDTIDAVPFLTASDKEWFKARKEVLA